jgi:glycosyltransferase involved in cell wall biosynthesis
MPLISCICPTYNRPPHHQHLLEEAIESFLRQDYPHKELIVLNDTPGQELSCEAEAVAVVNVSRRFRTLGEKWNAAVGLSRGDLIAPWDDDDISLPWRLSYSVERLGDADYFNPRAYWNVLKGQLRHDGPIGYGHNAGLYTRAAFELVGGHKPISLGLDRYLDREFTSRLERVIDPKTRKSPPPAMEEWFYIYRWGVSPAHVSARSDGDGSRRYAEIGARPVVSGCYYLQPAWQRDYVQATRDAIAGLAANPPPI